MGNSIPLLTSLLRPRLATNKNYKTKHKSRVKGVRRSGSISHVVLPARCFVFTRLTNQERESFMGGVRVIEHDIYRREKEGGGQNAISCNSSVFDWNGS